MCDNHNLIWLMRPVPPHQWAGPGPRVTVVRMETRAQDRVRATLARFWGTADERVHLPRAALERAAAAARAALVDGLTPAVRKDLLWITSLLR